MPERPALPSLDPRYYSRPLDEPTLTAAYSRTPLERRIVTTRCAWCGWSIVVELGADEAADIAHAVLEHQSTISHEAARARLGIVARDV